MLLAERNSLYERNSLRAGHSLHEGHRARPCVHVIPRVFGVSGRVKWFFSGMFSVAEDRHFGARVNGDVPRRESAAIHSLSTMVCGDG
ncbi:hypothetical protein ALMP_38680 [Streptomyces sp. A012304]|nr:hypothetical protein ALMP_38680 [Streptomyces sp. A012304]